jgi:glycogen(starch) synthase
MVVEKGFDLALIALAEIRRHFPTAMLTCIGDGPARKSLEELARSLGIGPAVDFPGWVEPDDVFRWMERSSMVLMPSRWEEPFGLMALQGAQMMRPVVAARTGGLPEVVIDGRTGLLFDRDDAGALAECVLRLLRDQEFARSLGRAGRLRALEEFPLGRQVDSYETLYAQACSKGGSSCAF